MRVTANDSSERKGTWIGVNKGASIPLDPRAGQLDPLELEREKARRILIYRDMLAQTGKIDFARLASWPNQPSDEDIAAELAELQGRRDYARSLEVSRLGGVRSHRSAS